MSENVPNWDAELMAIDAKVFAKIDSPYYDTFPGKITGYDATSNEYIIQFDDLELGTRHVPDYNVFNESEEKTDSEEEKADLNFFSDDDVEDDQDEVEVEVGDEVEEIPDSKVVNEDEENLDGNKLNVDEKITDKDKDKESDLNLLNEDEEKPDLKTSNEDEEKPVLNETTDDKIENVDDEVYSSNKCTKSFLTALARLEQLTRMKTTKIENLSKFNDKYEQLENQQEREKFQRRTVSILFSIHRLNADLIQPLGLMHNFLKENSEKEEGGAESSLEKSLLKEQSVCATELAFEDEVRKVHIDSKFNQPLIKAFHTILVLASRITPDNHMMIYSVIEAMVTDLCENLTDGMADQLKKMTYTYMHPLGKYSLFGEVKKPDKLPKEEEEEVQQEEVSIDTLIKEHNTTNIIDNINDNMVYDLVPYDNQDQIMFPSLSEDGLDINTNENGNFMYTTIPYNQQDQMLFPVMSEDGMTDMDVDNDEKIIYSSMPLVGGHQQYSIFPESFVENSATSVLETTNETDNNIYNGIPYGIGDVVNLDDVDFMFPMTTGSHDRRSMDTDEPDYVFQYSLPLSEEEALDYTLE